MSFSAHSDQRPQVEVKDGRVEDREARRRLLHRLDRRRTILAAGAVGALSGAVAVGFRLIVERSERMGHSLASMLLSHGVYGLIVLALVGGVLGAFAGFLTDRFAPDAGGSGVPQAKGAIMGLRPIRPWRLVGVKLLGGCAALSAGFSAGREGPTIHLGAATGEIFGRVFKVPARSKRTLIAAGAGAGLAAAFNAPLAGFLFVMEELKREMSPLTYGTALIGSVVAVGVARFALGGGSSFDLAAPPIIPLSRLPAMAIVGVASGLLGVVFNKALMAGSGWRIRRQFPRWIAGGCVGLATGLLLALWPSITGGSHDLAERALQGDLLGVPVMVLLGLLVAKLLLTIASYSTGVPGGFFAPLLVMGSLVGLLVGIGLRPIHSLAMPPATLASVGMAAILAGSLRAPLTGVVLIIEMTGQYSLLYDLLVASFVSYATAEFLHDTPIYEALLERDLHHGRPVSEHEGEVVEAFVETGSKLDGASIRSLRLPDNVTIAMIERDGRTLAPRGNTVVRFGDHLTLIAGAEGPVENVLAVVDSARAP